MPTCARTYASIELVSPSRIWNTRKHVISMCLEACICAVRTPARAWVCVGVRACLCVRARVRARTSVLLCARECAPARARAQQGAYGPSHRRAGVIFRAAAERAQHARADLA